MTEEVESSEARRAETGADRVPALPAGMVRVNKTELVWPGKYDESGRRRVAPRVNLPFQVIERVNESRAMRESRIAPQQGLFEMFDPKEGATFEAGWRNKLIWGDNLLVMGSLLERFAGKIDLIYIDPPFATGLDFSFIAEVGDAELPVTKEQSAIEENAYRDTWGAQGPGHELDSYLVMASDRVDLMADLLSSTGVLAVHVDWRLGPYYRALLDATFGRGHFVNELIWRYGKMSNASRRFAHSHDQVMVYSKGDSYPFNIQAGGVSEYRNRYERWLAPDNTLRYGAVKRSSDQLIQLRVRKVEKSLGRSVRDDDVLFDFNAETKVYDDVFTDISIVKGNSEERTAYPTQKPEALLQRLVRAYTDEGALVADFFVGSGTTLAAAETLGRRWLGCDLSRFAVHVTRKRLLDIPKCKPFEILNLGRYERQYWQGIAFTDGAQPAHEESLFQYLAFILKLYGAQPVPGLSHLHGKRGHAFVHVGAVDAPVTIAEVTGALDECAALRQRELHVLGWEWEMGMVGPEDGGLIQRIAKDKGIKLSLLQIPREVMDQQAAAKGEVKFFELAYVELDIRQPKALTVRVKLKDFVIPPDTEWVPAEVRAKIRKWSDYIDYWAVDWDFKDDTFIQGWVTYRTRKDRSLALESDAHPYERPGRYTILVKVVDIFGNDTSQARQVDLK